MTHSSDDLIHTLYTNNSQTLTCCQGLSTDLQTHVSICLHDICMYKFNRPPKKNMVQTWACDHSSWHCTLRPANDPTIHLVVPVNIPVVNCSKCWYSCLFRFHSPLYWWELLKFPFLLWVYLLQWDKFYPSAPGVPKTSQWNSVLGYFLKMMRGSLLWELLLCEDVNLQPTAAILPACTESSPERRGCQSSRQGSRKRPALRDGIWTPGSSHAWSIWATPWLFLNLNPSISFQA